MSFRHTHHSECAEVLYNLRSTALSGTAVTLDLFVGMIRRPWHLQLFRVSIIKVGCLSTVTAHIDLLFVATTTLTHLNFPPLLTCFAPWASHQILWPSGMILPTSLQISVRSPCPHECLLIKLYVTAALSKFTHVLVGLYM